jgi:hypothetical protein
MVELEAELADVRDPQAEHACARDLDVPPTEERKRLPGEIVRAQPLQQLA